jgi:hypothetical protein
VATPERSTLGKIPGDAAGPPPPAFFAELAAAFRRHRPQGSPRWNFSAAFTRLDQLFGSARPADVPHDRSIDAPGAEGGAPADAAGRGLLKRSVDRHVLTHLQPWIAEQAEAAARRALAAELGRVEEGFASTTEALRFLAARVEAGEDAAARRTTPVEGMAWLAPPPDLGPWVGPVAALLRHTPGGGPVVHAECGDGAFATALAAALGTAPPGGPRGPVPAVRGCEPRGAAALEASERGVDVHVGAVDEFLAGAATGSLAGLVLSGVVDRVPLDEQLRLLGLVTDRLAAGAALVVVGTRPEAVAAAWGPVAADLLPGRPLHAETWALLLERAGYVEVGRCTADGADGADVGTYAVGARRPA